MSSAAVVKKIILKKLKALDTIWHPESTLVFKSQKERLVIGRYIDKKLIDLDEEALSICEEWKFKPDLSLIEDPEEEEEENEESKEEDQEESNGESKDEESNGESKEEDQEESNGESKEEDTIKKIAKKFTENLDKLVDKMNEKNQLVIIELENTKVELQELQKKYDKLHNKFETMKSLFE